VPKDAILLIDENKNKELYPFYIDTFLAKQMRQHQIEGVRFMFECISGLRANNIKGCILAVKSISISIIIKFKLKEKKLLLFKKNISFVTFRIRWVLEKLFKQ
jgi:hypothetical protein